MPSYSSRSTSRLNTCSVKLIKLFLRVIGKYDNSILTGHRPESEQKKMYEAGRSKINWPYGKHNSVPSRAVDAAPYPIPDKWAAFPKLTEEMSLQEIEHTVFHWAKDLARFYHFGGYVQGVADTIEEPVRWGGDWDNDRQFNDQSFDDLVHFELRD